MGLFMEQLQSADSNLSQISELTSFFPKVADGLGAALQPLECRERTKNNEGAVMQQQHDTPQQEQFPCKRKISVPQSQDMALAHTTTTTTATTTGKHKRQKGTTALGNTISAAAPTKAKPNHLYHHHQQQHQQPKSKALGAQTMKTRQITLLHMIQPRPPPSPTSATTTTVSEKSLTKNSLFDK